MSGLDDIGLPSRPGEHGGHYHVGLDTDAADLVDHRYATDHDPVLHDQLVEAQRSHSELHKQPGFLSGPDYLPSATRLANLYHNHRQHHTAPEDRWGGFREVASVEPETEYEVRVEWTDRADWPAGQKIVHISAPSEAQAKERAAQMVATHLPDGAMVTATIVEDWWP